MNSLSEQTINNPAYMASNIGSPKDSNFDGKASSSSYHWLGDQVHIGIEINGSSIIGVADRNFEPSSDVKLNFPAESINIFNLETEEVILNGL